MEQNTSQKNSNSHYISAALVGLGICAVVIAALIITKDIFSLLGLLALEVPVQIVKTKKKEG